ncbi:MAG TPA: ClpXP protease specificity-enhancing factor [Limnobacter sp.]|uniref:ClpXP protease specificity-enhancing factor n=1 Tax=Limnobacter sp. TaxID=2003368 RepID=UPI002EDABF00
MSEVSTKPYLIRAIHEWAVDNGFTPYLAVAVNEKTQVPREFVKAGEIVLNVSPLATNKLRLGNEWVEFEARFGGKAREIMVPIEQVSAIYARENGHGMAFEVLKPLAEIEGDGNEAVQFVLDDEPSEQDATIPISAGPRPVEGPASDSKPMAVVKSDGPDEKNAKKPGPKSKSHLTRVK